ncbi:MAG: VOC family protein [Rikenellaceae bacterium]|nr:VOC family protein [Rikenellaceae bacterium]
MEKLLAFFEIPAGDFERAVDFYETVLELKLSVTEREAEKMAFFPEENGKYPGAISFTNGFEPSKDGVLISLQVRSMEETIARIETSGGRIVKSKTKIEAEGMGFFALFSDSEGNTVGLYSDN